MLLRNSCLRHALPLALCLILITLAAKASHAAEDSTPTPRPTVCQGTVALTFDDGPHSELTPMTLDILNAYQVKATFFVLGYSIEGNEHIIIRMVEEGHSVQSHTYDHPFLNEMGDEEVSDQIIRANEAIEKSGAPKPVYIRPPYGEYTKETIDVIESEGLHSVTWTNSLDVRDWDGLSAKEIEETILAGLTPGGVILLHDIQPNTVAALPHIIEGIHQRDYCINLYQGEEFWNIDV